MKHESLQAYDQYQKHVLTITLSIETPSPASGKPSYKLLLSPHPSTYVISRIEEGEHVVHNH